MSVQEIVTETAGRVETGAVKFTQRSGGSDWPGLFVRGDDCIALAFAIRHVLGQRPGNASLADVVAEGVLKGYADTIFSDVVMVARDGE